MINIIDVAYVRYRAPDLDVMEGFLRDFGMLPSARANDALYMRGLGKAHHIHITERGEAAALGFGVWVASHGDLDKAAAEFGVKVEDNPEPGGGKRVRLTDPAGFMVDLLHGQQELEPIPHRPPTDVNFAEGSRLRQSTPIRLEPAPAHVMRLGHVVLMAEDHMPLYDFYRRLFGLKVSDGYYHGTPENRVAFFMHLNSESNWVDHHAIAVIKSPDGKTRFDHTAFEVLDIDDVFQGHAYLEERQHRLSWGVGRHVEGSQVFDYWRDPWGHKIEHWTDGDLVNNHYPEQYFELNMESLAQWAPPLTPAFFE